VARCGHTAQRARVVLHEAWRSGQGLGTYPYAWGVPQVDAAQQPRQRGPERPVGKAAFERGVHGLDDHAGAVAVGEVVGGLLAIVLPERLQVVRVVAAKAQLQRGRAACSRFVGVGTATAAGRSFSDLLQNIGGIDEQAVASPPKRIRIRRNRCVRLWTARLASQCWRTAEADGGTEPPCDFLAWAWCRGP
jgi:hypothetical protein